MIAYSLAVLIINRGYFWHTFLTLTSSSKKHSPLMWFLYNPI
ncbi:hypothetical protein SSYIS1_20140 [Serratia symbiotica]|uniref:Uncharacterized protein n=1 Tax=Serratia symbiotica TaxID=138074 RepID=A0A455VLC3_9GAMM|nr:hypothetical protein SSYIS1_20140 [Serratia symbiotica]